MFKQRWKTLSVWAISLSCMVSETNQQETMMSSSCKYSQAKAAKAKAAKESIFGKIHFDSVLQQQHATSPEPYNSPGTRKKKSKSTFFFLFNPETLMTCEPHLQE